MEEYWVKNDKIYLSIYLTIYLRVKINNDKENKFGYINASHISATVGDSQRFYIAAQGKQQLKRLSDLKGGGG